MTIKAITEDGRHMDPRFSYLMMGPKASVMSMCINTIFDVLLEPYPNHWTLEDLSNEPDWEDWNDFLTLNETKKRTK